MTKIIFVLLFVALIGSAYYLYQEAPKMVYQKVASRIIQEQTTKDIEKNVGQVGQKGIVGEVKSVSKTAIELLNQNNGTTLTFQLDESTKVTNNNTETSLAQLKAGNDVLVYTNGSTGKVSQIVVNPQRIDQGYNSGPKPI